MRTATRSAAILSSLFPTTFRARLEETAVPDSIDDEPPKSRLHNFLMSRRLQVEEREEVDSKQIAEHFESATVLFADIKGFTMW